MDYYTQKQYIPRVNEQGEILGPVEKWEAHTKGILHRAFTVALIYNNAVILQHRKHPAFDGFYDLTLSSHPLYDGDTLIPEIDTVYTSLKREWNVEKDQLLDAPKEVGAVIYEAHDEKGGFIEHEMDALYIAEIDFLPTPDLQYAYGYSLVDLAVLKDKSHRIQALIAPWVTPMLEKNFI